MTATGHAGHERDLDHSSIDAPFRGELVEFTYRRGAEWEESHMNVVFGGTIVWRRRFGDADGR
ncbi:MAG: hypothetical protein RLZZ326_3701 [Planctomycetota bacterium]